MAHHSRRRGTLDQVHAEWQPLSQGAIACRLVRVLAELHDRLGALVLQAYGWTDLASTIVGRPGGTTPWVERPALGAEAEEELLTRLVALNIERAAKEGRGFVRWLRPQFQNPTEGIATPTPTQGKLGVDAETALRDVVPGAVTRQPRPKQTLSP